MSQLRFVQPRRFSECWQMSSDFPGTVEQQQTVRDAYQLEYGTRKHQLFQLLDRSLNQVYGRSYAVVAFLPPAAFPPWTLAQAWDTGINISDEVAAGSGLVNLALHEFGHVVDGHLMTQDKKLWYMHEVTGPDLGTNDWRTYVEPFADSVRDCINGIGWQELWPILLPEEG